MNDTRRFAAFPRLASTALLLVAFALVPLAAAAATIETDKEDYSPGETVIMFGSGWEPFETVDLVLQEEPDTANDVVLIAVADANGDILNDDFIVEWHHFQVSFLLTATGRSSGFTAQTTFTDAVLANAINGVGDSIMRAFNAGSCTYGDQVDRNFATGDNHGATFCGAGGDGTFSHAERLECAKNGDIANANAAASGGDMRNDMQSQSTTVRTNLSSAPSPRYVVVLQGHNDACTNTTTKTGNGCGGDQDPNNYCRTTNAAFEREFREGMDQLIQVPTSRILVSALVRVSELCNFGSKSTCGIGSIFGSCTNLWQGLAFINGNGVCRSLTADCSNTRRIDMYNTIVAYNEILQRVSAEYAAIPAGGLSANGVMKSTDVGIRYVEAPFHYKFASGDISCCDCFHPDDTGQALLAEGTYQGLQCSAATPCCAQSADPLTNATCSATDSTSVYPGGFWAGNPCGNGVVDPGEGCDLGNANGTPGTCCLGNCQLVSSGTVCRASTGGCDPQETCNGTSGACPANVILPAGATCRASGGICDIAETCDGTSGTCPADAKSTAQCRAAGGPCDVAEICDGLNNACPTNVFQPNTLECRASAGVCDLAESCTGLTAACPADAKSAAVCRSATGTCDVAESCDGAGNDCPADVLRPSGFECRGSAGGCDPAETCDGASGSCPSDALASSGTLCRTAAGDCDVAETCNGSSAACPADAKSTGLCRNAAGTCDVAETCDGITNDCPADTFEPSTVECRGSAGDCDLAESCTGASAACPADAKSTGECRAATGACDVAETCDGVSDACPADVLESAGHECRPAAGDCDVAETCDGSTGACPADALVPSTFECRASAGACDVAEHCSGADPACPADAKSTAECRTAAGDCDVAESCDGIADACPPDAFQPATVECRAASGDCDVAESCTGTTAACPSDTLQPDGTTCNDGAACTTPDTCVSGQCQGNPLICGDGVVQGGCGETCDDGNGAGDDGCSATCQVESTPGCGATPQLGCRQPAQPGKAVLLLKNKTPDSGDLLTWKWTKGAVTPKADFGSPTTITAYQLCIYDGASSLVSSTAIPAGGTCAGKPCWSEKSSGFKYADKDATPNGITKITLKQGLAPGVAKIGLKGKGTNLNLPGLPLAQPVTVQLRNGDGVCWEAVYGAPAGKNDGAQFKDKSD